MKCLSLLALASLLATPAQSYSGQRLTPTAGDPSGMRTSLFVGASYRVGLDHRSTTARHRVSLKFSGMAYDPANARFRFADGVELTHGVAGKPTVRLAGPDVGDIRRSARLNGTTTVVPVGGAVLLAVVAAVAISRIEPSRCIGEKGDCD